MQIKPQQHPGDAQGVFSALPSEDSRPAARVAALEAMLGDPRDPTNPLGDAAVLAAHQRSELPLGGEPLLASYGLHEEFVPVEWGGRMTGLDTVARMLRAVARRDFALSRGAGSATVVAALFAWCYGTPDQQRWVARALLDGGRLSPALRKMAYGNEFSSGSLTATLSGNGGGLVLQGRTPGLVNAPLAAGFIAIPHHVGGSTGDTALLLSRDELPSGAVRELSPTDTAGIRKLPVGELRFDNWPVPRGAVLGETGRGSAVMLRALQLSRPMLPSMAVGSADMVLRSVLSAVLAQEARGGGDLRPLTSRYTRQSVVSAFADLLICDCLSLVAIRALHVLPCRSSLASAAAKFLVPRMLEQSAGDLAPVLGAQALRMEPGGEHFRKHLRDLTEIPPGYVGSAAALSTVLPQLPTLSRRAIDFPVTAPPELFFKEGELPPLDVGRLRVASDNCPLTPLLTGSEELIDSMEDLGPYADALRSQLHTLADEVRRMGEECRTLPERRPSALANPRGFALAERYTLLVAAASCLGVWLHAERGGKGFLADPAWLVTALGRVCLRLGLPVARTTEEQTDFMLAEAVDRCIAGRSLDLYDTVLGAAGPEGAGDE